MIINFVFVCDKESRSSWEGKHYGAYAVLLYKELRIFL